MDLADVALFRTIASVGSLSAAARQMGTTPMLVSIGWQVLEAELGTRKALRIFQRATWPSPAVPTEGYFSLHPN